MNIEKTYLKQIKEERKLRDQLLSSIHELTAALSALAARHNLNVFQTLLRHTEGNRWVGHFRLFSISKLGSVGRWGRINFVRGPGPKRYETESALNEKDNRLLDCSLVQLATLREGLSKLLGRLVAEVG